MLRLLRTAASTGIPAVREVCLALDAHDAPVIAADGSLLLAGSDERRAFLVAWRAGERPAELVARSLLGIAPPAGPVDAFGFSATLLDASPVGGASGLFRLRLAEASTQAKRRWTDGVPEGGATGGATLVLEEVVRALRDPRAGLRFHAPPEPRRFVDGDALWRAFAEAAKGLDWCEVAAVDDPARPRLVFRPRTRLDAGVEAFGPSGSSDLLAVERYLKTWVCHSGRFRSLREVCLALDAHDAPVYAGGGVTLLAGPDERRALLASWATGVSPACLVARSPRRVVPPPGPVEAFGFAATLLDAAPVQGASEWFRLRLAPW